MTTGIHNNFQHKDRAYNLFNKIMSMSQADDLNLLIENIKLFINEKNATEDEQFLVREDLYSNNG